ncbi:PDK repeat-containing protein [Methanolobus tindarius DSM 2278]|uniref:PDK repeat-containing protein n=1 Tax=Methanolobus tindarius DSM 2278 TaxID=1090322 RepID=W9E081_METTI|nr:PKD domain-containing protein [Methanolobus tindarius]ETA69016.1 PDK repeat-containing protein [Methanolobus tindarius DSM 2278]
MKYTTFLLAILISILSIGIVTALELDEGQCIQLINNNSNQTMPSIYGNIIVWQDDMNGNMDIMMYDISTEESTVICNAEGQQIEPKVSDSYVVWTDGRLIENEPSIDNWWGKLDQIYQRNMNWDIMAYDISTGEYSNITLGLSKSQVMPSISGNLITYTDCYQYDYLDLEEEEEELDILRRDVVVRTPQSPQNDIYYFTGYHDQYDSYINENGMVWIDYEPAKSYYVRFGNFSKKVIEKPTTSIMYKDFTTNKVRTIYWTHEATFDLDEADEGDIASSMFVNPILSDKYIVWHKWRNNNYYIVYYNLETGEQASFSEAVIPEATDIENEYLVYSLSGSNSGTYLIDLSTKQKTKLYYDSSHPQISGEYVVWSARTENTYNVCLYRIDKTTPSITVNYPSPGQVIVGMSNITVTGSASDPNSFSLAVNNIEATFNSNDWFANVPLNEGDNSISVVATDSANNQNISAFKIVVHKNEDCYLLSPNIDTIETGGIYSRVYKTKYPNSKVTIITDEITDFTHTNTDENGIFAIKINTSDITTTGSKELSVNEVTIEHNDNTKSLNDTSIFNFTLSIIPRNYSTTWYTGKSMEAGGGPVVYVKGESATDFEMTAFNSDTNLNLQSSQEAGITVGAQYSAFEMETPGLNAEALGIDIHKTCTISESSQVSLDYANAPNSEKRQAISYMLSSIAPSSTSIKLLNFLSSYNSESQLNYDFCEIGAGISEGASASLFKLNTNISPVLVNDASLGVGYEGSKLLSLRTYNDRNPQYRLQTVSDLSANLDWHVSSFPLIDWGYTDSADFTTILELNDNNTLNSKHVVKATEVIGDNLIGGRRAITKEVTYDIGEITSEDMIKNNPFNSNLLTVLNSQIFSQLATTYHDDYTEIKSEESYGEDVGIDIPFKLTVDGIKLDLGVGLKAGIANNYLTDKGLVFGQKDYYYINYPDNSILQNPVEYHAKNLSDITLNLIDSINYDLESSPEDIYTVIDGPMNEISLLSGSNISDENVTIVSYVPEKPTEETMNFFADDSISTDFIESSSGANIMINSVNDIQSSGTGDFSNVQLNLAYSEEDISSFEMNESTINNGMQLYHDIFCDKIVWSNYTHLVISDLNNDEDKEYKIGLSNYVNPVISENYIAWTTFTGASLEGNIGAYNLFTDELIRVTNSSERSINKVLNGGFETGDFAGWTVSCGGGWSYVYGSANVINNRALLRADTREDEIDSFSLIRQNINLTNASELCFTYSMYDGYEFSGSIAQFVVYIDDEDVYGYQNPNSGGWGIPGLRYSNGGTVSIDISEYTGNHEVVFMVYCFDFAECEVYLDSISVMSTPTSSCMPDISDSNLVWMDKSEYYGGDIFMCNLSTGSETKISTDDDYYFFESEPSISENYIVWTGINDTTLHTDIRMYDISTKETVNICSDSGNQFSPDVSGNLIVWVDDRNGDCDIYLYNLTSDETAILCNESGNQTNPCIYGNRIVWTDDRDDNPDIYMYDLNSNEEIVICNNSFNQSSPVLGGDYIAWIDDRNGYPQTVMKSIIDESKLSIYEWNDEKDSWVPHNSSIDKSLQIVSTNLSSELGTYGIGYDNKKPIIEWDYSDIYIGNITVNVSINDEGSGVNNSSIKLIVDGQEQNFTYSIYSGLLLASLDESYGNHTIKIYATDTSNNIASTPEIRIRNVKPVSITNLSIREMDDDNIELSWIGVNGDYDIDEYYIYRDNVLLNNTSQTYYVTSANYGSIYTVYSVDTERYTGIKDSIELTSNTLIPKFTYDWENTLNPEVGNPIVFDANNSTIISGTFEKTVQYEWIIDDDTNKSKYGNVVEYVFLNPGLHKVTLNLKDEQSTSNTSWIIEVYNNTMSFTSNVTEGEVPLSVHFYENSGYADSWYWNFGDGNTSTEQNPIHTYSNAGTYNVEVNVSNATSYFIETKEDYIHAYSSQVTDFHTNAQTVYVGQNITFYDDSNNNPSTWQWNFGDGSTSTEQNPIHAYNEGGLYTVQLNILTEKGYYTETKSDYIHVVPIDSFTEDFSDGNYNAWWADGTWSASSYYLSSNVDYSEISVSNGGIYGNKEINFKVKNNDPGELWVFPIQKDWDDNSIAIKLFTDDSNKLSVEEWTTERNEWNILHIDTKYDFQSEIGAWYHIKLQYHDAGYIKFKIWKDGTSEPIDWDWEGICDPSVDGEYFEVYARNVGVNGCGIDDISITSFSPNITYTRVFTDRFNDGGLGYWTSGGNLTENGGSLHITDNRSVWIYPKSEIIPSGNIIVQYRMRCTDPNGIINLRAPYYISPSGDVGASILYDALNNRVCYWYEEESCNITKYDYKSESGNWYWFKYYQEDNTAYYKHWKYGESEPTLWDWYYNNPLNDDHRTFFMESPQLNSGYEFTYDDYSVYVISNCLEPIANFVSDVTYGVSPLTVQFTDVSTGANSWNWNFGDGSTSTEQNPTHTYVGNRDYNVQLNVSNQYGYNLKTKQYYISVVEPEYTSCVSCHDWDES